MLSIKFLADSLQLLVCKFDALPKAVVIGGELRFELADCLSIACLASPQLLYLFRALLSCLLDLHASASFRKYSRDK